MKKISEREALQFYIENGLTEIFSEIAQNNFLLKEKIVVQKKLLQDPKMIEKKMPNFFSNPAQSSAQAIFTLGQKAQNNSKTRSETAHGEEPISNSLPASLGASYDASNFKKSATNILPTSLENSFSSSMVNGSRTNAGIVNNGASEMEKFKSLNEILSEAKNLAASAKTLPELRKIVENFDGCNLKKMATNTVFCDGNANSKIMVIGEAPGNHEDLQGIPFCGDSGKVLDEMFGAINMKRAENFYITNVIFWRPPGNRRPTDEELAICRPFVERHIQLMNPEVLVLVGATAMSAVLGINDPVTQVRGKFIDFSPKFLPRKIKTFTIFHPSYLMRQPMKKKVAWLDMLALEKFLQNLN